MPTYSKQVIAWGDGLIHDYLLDVLKRRRKRSPGDEYSTKQDDGITTKLIQIPQTGMGSPTRDIGHERTPGDPPEVGSGNKADAEIYGADAPPDDETKPGGGRMINPRGEPPVPTQQQVSINMGDPVAIKGLFDSGRDLDRKPYQRTNNLYDTDLKPRHKTRDFINSLYNKKPVKLRSATKL